MRIQPIRLALLIFNISLKVRKFHRFNLEIEGGNDIVFQIIAKDKNRINLCKFSNVKYFQQKGAEIKMISQFFIRTWRIRGLAKFSSPLNRVLITIVRLIVWNVFASFVSW